MDVKRPVRLAITASLCLLALSPPAQARAADQVIAHDTMIRSVYALGGDLVYYRHGPRATLPKRVWMRRVGGKLHRVTAIPRHAYPAAVGRDAKGRKILTFVTERITDHAITDVKWFVYDLARDRSRRVRGLPRGCVVGWLSVWRDSMAYADTCKTEADGGVFVRQGRRTRKINSDPYGAELVFRDGELVGNFDTGLDDFVVIQYMARGEVCHKVLYSSYGDATSENGWYPSDVWLGDGSMTWQMGQWFAQPNFALLTAKLPSRCATPGSVREIPFEPQEGTLGPHAVDGRRIFYTNGDGSTLRLHLAPAKPSVNPPANDDFEDAGELPGVAPFHVSARLAYATVQRGEPLAGAKHTVWYGFHATKSGTVYVSVSGGAIYDFKQQHYVGTTTFGVYTGTSRKSLAEIKARSGQAAVRIDAEAGQTYWIAIGSPFPEPNFQPIGLYVNTAPPSG